MRRVLSAIIIAGLMTAPAFVMAGNHTEGLPPGLQKKVEQGKPLPPGWQKKLNIDRGDRLYDDLYSYGTVRDLGDNRQEVKVEDRVYTVIKDTREIIDILDQ